VNIGDIRVGSGFDVHAFSADPARALVLGGVTVAEARGLVGHSDADVIAHACAEALLGAAGLGDLGSWFPDSDPTYSDADSVQLLRTVTDGLRRDGWTAVNIDCSVVCEEPKLAPHRDEMQRRLSDAVGAPVTVKGRRAEGMGALGRREGIACWAVALIARHSEEL
jgi:2-C-methyl-D-erythritol 2,4-cyclodiphosphate synthase